MIEKIRKYPISVRLTEEENNFFKSKAAFHKISISEYVRQLIFKGIVSESVQEVEAKIKEANQVLVDFSADIRSLKNEQERMKKSQYLSEEILKAIAQAKDIPQFYAAQDRAIERLKKEKS